MKKLLLSLFLLSKSFVLIGQSDADIDLTFINGPGPLNGASTNVNTVAFQSDGKMLVGGGFTFYNGLAQSRLVRLNINGTKDTSFDIGSGFSHEITAIVVQPDGKILVGGGFNTVNGAVQNRLIRLNADGTKDTSFNIGAGFNGVNIHSIALQSDGKILVGGNFTNFNGTNQNNLIRLNSSGSRDTTFNTGTGFDGNVLSIAIQSDGKIIAGGYFSNFNGTAQKELIRLNQDGTKDTTFNIGTGFTPAGSSVKAISIQNDGKIVVGGDFTIFNGVQSNRVIRLNTDGTKDSAYTIGTGFNGPVYTILKQANGKMLVGGQFNSYNGSSPNNKIIRLNTDGTRDATFSSLSGFNGTVVSSLAINSNGNILVGGTFTTYRGNSTDYIVRLVGNSVLSSSDFNTKSLKFSLYPNPTNDLLNVTVESDLKSVEIYSLQGQKVLNTNTNTNTFSIANLSNGLYMVRVEDENGAVATQKLMKQ